MRTFTWLAAAALLLSVAGCDQYGIDNDTERGLAGAATGAIISDATGGSALTGALIGGAIGVFCDDANVPGCINR